MRSRNLHIAFCTREAAEYACKNWHYSRRFNMSGGCATFGVWERGEFIGAVVYARSSCNNIGRPFGLRMQQVCELTRVALRDHDAPVSRIVAITLKMLRRSCSALQLVVSYADTERGHHGGIYQAGNWIYLGTSQATEYVIHGMRIHGRSAGKRYGSRKMPWLRTAVDPNARVVCCAPKHKYVYPLTREWRRKLEKLAKPYPKRRPGRGAEVPTSAGGANPTPALQHDETS